MILDKTYVLASTNIIFHHFVIPLVPSLASVVIQELLKALRLTIWLITFTVWRNMLDTIQTTLHFTNGFVYFFKGNQYIKWKPGAGGEAAL